ncbi:MAG: GAF domain-containing protein, partial [Gammaproteobacteria bacterium]|nr:GAF domain-containing protein [Gammaproteobacteria bacterium]
FPHALFVAHAPDLDSDLTIQANADESAFSQLITHGEDNWRRHQQVLDLFLEVGAKKKRMRQLSEIGLSLSTRMGLDELLETILQEARMLAGCDAGSLYLAEEFDGMRTLVFKLAQNDSVDVPFVESRLPLSRESVAGYVAVSGQELDIADVYELPESAPYRFNRSFDEQMGYRTRSMLVIPMRDHRGQIVGVLQFINRKESTAKQPVPFGPEIAELLRAIASQAAVSIQKNTLIRDINQLFESFVHASIKTIEQRDPSTSGHSFRVAETTLELLQALPQSDLSRFRGVEFSDEHIREVRYAALLHDFGKVAVREDVLVKSHKLPTGRLELIRYRVELQKERLRRSAAARELELVERGASDLAVARSRVQRALQAELDLLSHYYERIVSANEPNLLDDGDYRHLREIRGYTYRNFDDKNDGLISESEMLALSVRKGSLTPEERLEIESHVVNTQEFLTVLPWPPELARVPEIAGAHHEKLDGSGYPAGLRGEEIPLASRVMTVCDIYDALTAADRPYKRAMSREIALGILEDEARQGLLDTDIVTVFIEAGIHASTHPGIAELRSA